MRSQGGKLPAVVFCITDDYSCYWELSMDSSLALNGAWCHGSQGSHVSVLLKPFGATTLLQGSRSPLVRECCYETT